jgi:NAD(P)-dependent dehydrogenase (short-subunit alcohol dehydrogenase family)
MEMFPSGRVAGKVALVTGAASGIGRATALLLAREGASVAVTDRDEQGAAATARELLSEQRKSLVYGLDVTAEADWTATIENVLEIWGQLDILVNNAGISFGKPVTEMTLDEWRAVMAVNMDGVFLGTKHAVQAMRKGRGGSIVNISSASGLKAAPGASAYCTSKAGVRLFSKSVALECAQAGDNIRVNCVLPGGVVTPMWESMEFWQEMAGGEGGAAAAWEAMGQTVPLKRYAQPEEVAQAVLYLASDEAQYVTGAELVIDGGYTA